MSTLPGYWWRDGDKWRQFSSLQEARTAALAFFAQFLTTNDEGENATPFPCIPIGLLDTPLVPGGRHWLSTVSDRVTLRSYLESNQTEDNDAPNDFDTSGDFFGVFIDDFEDECYNVRRWVRDNEPNPRMTTAVAGGTFEGYTPGKVSVNVSLIPTTATYRQRWADDPTSTLPSGIPGIPGGHPNGDPKYFWYDNANRRGLFKTWFGIYLGTTHLTNFFFGAHNDTDATWLFGPDWVSNGGPLEVSFDPVVDRITGETYLPFDIETPAGTWGVEWFDVSIQLYAFVGPWFGDNAAIGHHGDYIPSNVNGGSMVANSYNGDENWLKLSTADPTSTEYVGWWPIYDSKKMFRLDGDETGFSVQALAHKRVPVPYLGGEWPWAVGALVKVSGMLRYGQDFITCDQRRPFSVDDVFVLSQPAAPVDLWERVHEQGYHANNPIVFDATPWETGFFYTSKLQGEQGPPEPEFDDEQVLLGYAAYGPINDDGTSDKLTPSQVYALNLDFFGAFNIYTEAKKRKSVPATKALLDLLKLLPVLINQQAPIPETFRSIGVDPATGADIYPFQPIVGVVNGLRVKSSHPVYGPRKQRRWKWLDTFGADIRTAGKSITQPDGKVIGF